MIEWFKQDGEVVSKDDPLFELETDKITMQVQAETAGRLSVAVAAGENVEVGQAVGSIDTAAEAPAAPAAAAESESARDLRATTEMDRSEPQAKSKGSASASRVSPAVRRLAEEKNIDLGQIEGTGKDGRVTKTDVVRYLDGSGDGASRATTAWVPVKAPAVSTPAASSQPSSSASEGRETRTPMSSMRRRIAERLVQAQQTAAILTTFNEVDLSEVMALRARFKDRFLERHGVKLGFMSFFVKATVEALRTVPALNARIEGDEIVQNHYYDIGVAVGTPKGLVVPVLREADQLGFAGIEKQIGDMAGRAQKGRLELRELQGGCFTISNGGVYGSMLSTPILNPPQSGILGMHGIKKRPVVLPDDRIEARPMMYLAVSYDHRLVDGKEAVTFLRTIVSCLEDPSSLMFEV